MNLSRRQFLALGGCSVLGYSALIEPHLLECSEKTVHVPSPLTRPIRLLHLSDLHWSSVVSLAFLAQAVERSLRLAPDLIVLTGDYVTDRSMNLPDLVPVLRRLSAAAPVFATFGNHDGGAWAARASGYPTLEPVRAMLEVAGIAVLFNGSTVWKDGGSEIVLAGVGDLWAGDVRPEEAFRGIDPADPRPKILLSHNPDSKDLLRDYPWDLMLCGHTHGGQLIIPFIGAAPFSPIRDRRYAYGLCPWESRQIHVTRGVGNLHGVRFNCRPELSLLRIVSRPMVSP